ncbi:MAG: prolyl oligopeptidase family serine peptidase [Rubripirellula sp.]|nr:prolyl oligopeptidase family serine peptidase [Rubripirellula sp.]
MFVAIAAVPVYAQDLSRRPLQHSDYDVWNTMSRAVISGDGKWAMFVVQNGAIDGEATLHIRHVKTAREYVVERGSGAQLTDDSQFAIYRITPSKKQLTQLRKAKKPASEFPKAKLQILELESGKVTTLENVRSFKIPEAGNGWVACLMERPTGPDEVSGGKSAARESYEVTGQGLRRPAQRLRLKSREQLARERGEEKTAMEASKQKGASAKTSAVEEPVEKSGTKKKDGGVPLTLMNLTTGIRQTFPSVVSYSFSKRGNVFAFTTSVKRSGDGKSDADSNGKDKVSQVDEGVMDGVQLVKLDTQQRISLTSGTGDYKSMTLSEDGSHVAFLTNKDDYQSKTPTWSIYLWKSRSKEAVSVATEGDQGIPAGWWISPASNQRFSKDGRRLFFDTAPIPVEVVKERAAKAKGEEVDEDGSDGKAKLDLWHWQDPQLQPQQLLQAERERKRDYRAVYGLKSKKIVQLADRQIPDLNIDYRSSSDLAVANTNMRYRRMLSWDIPGYQDAYLVNLDTGERQLFLEKVKWNASISPEGKFITWFDRERKQWFAKTTANPNSKPIEISRGIRHPLQDELHDTPNLASAYGAAGWVKGDLGLLVYDRFDIWQLDPLGKVKPLCLTNGAGRKSNIRFRYRTLDREQQSIDLEQPMILDAFDRKTKASGFYSLRDAGPGKTNNEQQGKAKKRSLRPLIMLEEALGGLLKAKHSDAVIFTRSTFRACPDLWASNLDFKKIERISDINPQQGNYSWGTAELVHWKATDKQDLDGILLKPDGFDPAKKYPLMVYFYERKSDDLHRYYTPAAGRSIICHSFYVSRGYLVFIPDIPYKTGAPGPSAANAILPGVEHLVDQGFVDKERIGMQGHSWGGYQTAYLVTQTDLFACAESGAPVSNMTSAYGGIRWGSGLSRMFQYERTQSRIGEDLWSAREKYVANSPLFFADKINTPLLILHNDQDGAVPWYQGIELFVALRRLEKPAWMLNYNGEPHWVMDDYNRRDFATRMQQFFDHYLLDAPEPEWMAVGIPAVQKGENFGLELLEPVKEKSENEAGEAASK